jgi:3-methyladenine DNA glycosylase/8-oxoguanine DNA glycosylase
MPGVGKWTTQYVAMRALIAQRFSFGLLHATGSKTFRELELRTEPWRSWRAYASMYL